MIHFFSEINFQNPDTLQHALERVSTGMVGVF